MTVMMQHDRTGRLPLAALDLDEAERGLLVVLRHFLTSFAEPASHAWTLGYGMAAERWGQAEGPARAQALLGVVLALRGCRPEPFDFTDPMSLTGRGWLTADEAALMTMLHAMRRDRTAQAREALAGLCGGRMDVQVIRAGLALAALFPACPCCEAQAPRLH